MSEMRETTKERYRIIQKRAVEIWKENPGMSMCDVCRILRAEYSYNLKHLERILSTPT